MKPLTNETLIEFDKKLEDYSNGVYSDGDPKRYEGTEKKDLIDFIASAIQAKEREIQEKIIGEIEKRFKMFEQSKTGWMITGINIRLEDWKEFKSKLSNLSEK